MPELYIHRHAVIPEEIDSLGHVNNLAYLRWMLDAAVAHSAAQGWPTSRYLEIGAGWVVRSHSIEYLREALVNDLIEVETWVSGFKKITSLRKYRILRPADQTLLATAETNWAFIGYAHRVPRRIPSEVREAFQIRLTE